MEHHFTDPAIADALLRRHVDALDAARLSCVSRALREAMRALFADAADDADAANALLPPSSSFAAAAAASYAACHADPRVLGSVPKAHGAAVTCAAASGSVAATGAADGTVRVWDCARLRGESAPPLQVLRPGALAVSLARARAEGAGTAGGAGGATLPPPAPVSAVAVASLRPPSYAAAPSSSSSSQQRRQPQPPLLVATATDPLRPGAALPLGAAPEVRLWMGPSPPGRLLPLGEAAAASRVLTVAFAQRGALLVAGFEDGRVVAWDTGAGGGTDPKLRFSVQAFERGVAVTALGVMEGAPTGEDDLWRRAGLETCRSQGLVLVGSADNSVNALDAASGVPLLAPGAAGGGLPLGVQVGVGSRPATGGSPEDAATVRAICGVVVSGGADAEQQNEVDDEWMSAALAVCVARGSAIGQGADSALMLFAPKPPRHLRSPDDRSPLVSSASASASSSGVSTPASTSPAMTGGGATGLAMLEARFGGLGVAAAQRPRRQQHLARRLARKQQERRLLHPIMLACPSICAGTVHEPPVVLSAAFPAAVGGSGSGGDGNGPLLFATLALGAPSGSTTDTPAREEPHPPSSWLGGRVLAAGFVPLRWAEAIGRARRGLALGGVSPEKAALAAAFPALAFGHLAASRWGQGGLMVSTRLVPWYGGAGGGGSGGGPLPDARAGALVRLPGGGGWLGAIVGDADGTVRLLRFGDAAHGLEAVGKVMEWRRRAREREG